LIEDIHEPVELYKSVFKETHARNTSEYFEDLVRKSGIDEYANIKTVKDVRILEHQVTKDNSISVWWKALRVFVTIVGVICLFFAQIYQELLWLIGPLVAAALVIFKLNPLVKDVVSRLEQLKQQLNDKLEEAWQQMLPLNQLYDWNIVAKLVQQTVPRLEIDPYFTNGRLDELRNIFGWNDIFNRDCSES